MNQLTDVAQSSLSSTQLRGPLKWVGMENIKIPLKGLGPYPVEANLSAYVSLTKANQRGIHMSRVYELVHLLSKETVTRNKISNCLEKITASQNGSSDAAKIIIKFSLLLERKALLSDKKGFKSYPIQWTARNIRGKEHIVLRVGLDYSSTCPCSAALAREVISEEFESYFKGKELNMANSKEFLLAEKTWPAWPHAQRSRAVGHFLLGEQQQDLPDIEGIIDRMEEALGTPTQTAVKRIDEQEFARLNAKNLMFCEDAARGLKANFQSSDFKDFKFTVRHFESLHSHDVYAEVRRL